MLDEALGALRRRGLRLPAPLVVADSWFGDAKLMCHVRAAHQGTLLVEGKSAYVFHLPGGRRVKGADLLSRAEWPWRQSPQVPGVRYVRLSATSPTFGEVTLVVVEAPGS